MQGRHGGRGNLSPQYIDRKGTVGPCGSSNPSKAAKHRSQSRALLCSDRFSALTANRDLHGSDDPRVVPNIHGDGKIRRLNILSTAKPKRAVFDLADAKRIQDMLDDTITLQEKVVRNKGQLLRSSVTSTSLK